MTPNRQQREKNAILWSQREREPQPRFRKWMHLECLHGYKLVTNVSKSPPCPLLLPLYPFWFFFLVFCFFNVRWRQVFPVCMPTTIWEHATWEQVKQLNELALISEHDSIRVCLAACCFHSCIFYPPYRLDILLYGSGSQPDEGLKHNPNISILTHFRKNTEGARTPTLPQTSPPKKSKTCSLWRM